MAWPWLTTIVDSASWEGWGVAMALVLGDRVLLEDTLAKGGDERALALDGGVVCPRLVP